MTEPASRYFDPRRLAAILGVFLAPGAAAAVVLWHDVINPLLAGRPPHASAAMVFGAVVVLAVVVAALGVYLRRLTREGNR